MKSSRTAPREPLTAAEVEAEVMVTGDMVIAVRDTVIARATVTITAILTHTTVDMITTDVTTIISTARPTATATRPSQWLGLLLHPLLPSRPPLPTILLPSTHNTPPPLEPLIHMPHMVVIMRKSRFLVIVMAVQCPR